MDTVEETSSTDRLNLAAGQVSIPVRDTVHCDINGDFSQNTKHANSYNIDELDNDEAKQPDRASPKRKHTVNYDEHLESSFSLSPPKLLKETDNKEKQWEIKLNTDENYSSENFHPESCHRLEESSSNTEVTHGELLDSNANAEQDVESQSNEAAEIVKKLCKNGKVMQFQEGEDYIKVIVYEDSQESVDPEETLSTEEIESTCDGQVCALPDETETGKAGCKSQNLLERLLTPSTGDKYISSMGSAQNDLKNIRYEGMFSSPRTLSPVSCTMTPAAAIQSNFTNTVNQFAPSFLPYNMGEMGSAAILSPQYSRENQPVIPVSGNQVFCTPHPKNGYMFYVPEDLPTTMPAPRKTPLVPPTSTSTPLCRSNVPTSDRMVMSTSQNVHLNSSGEENVSPTNPLDTPVSSQRQLQQKVRSLIAMPQFSIDDNCKIREQHNQKERRRRARIKEACNLLRQLVPGMSDKTDKATVFEFAARYVHFLKSHTGTQFDKNFLMKYSPY